jgi:2-keto-4-pentenoate hydratase/2-oxohepta-3-ene-1,7-dioic acid hydratase in catechol pathway
MKLVTYHPGEDPGGGSRVGVLTADASHVIDLQAAHAHVHGQNNADFESMLHLLRAGQAGMDRVAEMREAAENGQLAEFQCPLDAARLLAPVPVPASLRDCMCFEQHLVDATRTVVGWKFPPLATLDRWAVRCFGRGLLRVPAVWRERPLYYKGNPHSVVGHDSEVRWPRLTERLDFELEFGIFIGREGSNIPEQRAAGHIAGYTVFNDFSARDIQLREMQGRLGPAKGKDFDTGNVLGPYLVTPDEVPQPDCLTAAVRVNGDTWSRTTTSAMQFSFPEIIAYISRDETLHVGDFIGAGTLPGGCGLEMDRWIQPGDEIELEVERLGVLRNQVVRDE